MTKEPFVICGELVLHCQEGGYCADALVIDREDLDWLVRDYFGIPEAGKAESDCRPVGRVRITIELLERDST